MGHNGGTWAASAGFPLREGEGLRIVRLFNDPSGVFTSSVTVDGTTYAGIKGDSQSIYGKKGSSGVILAKTAQTVLVGVYDEGQQPGTAALVVENLAECLREQAY
ncbi:profilin [Protofrankia coriariae]|uniref:profilin n=1 Tax=Protofrankia coriariae TaxID=1562887 RepID=UPI003B849FB6